MLLALIVALNYTCKHGRTVERDHTSLWKEYYVNVEVYFSQSKKTVLKKGFPVNNVLLT